MSVKLKITLWYSLFMVLLVGISFGLLLYFSASKIFSGVDQQLKNTVNRSFKEVSLVSGELTFDPDFHLLGLENGVYLSVYDEKGNFLYGDLPSYYNGSAYLAMDYLQEEYDFYTNWKIYDNQFVLNGYGPIWIRGITSQTGKEGWMVTILKACVIFLPFFVLAVSLSGYHIIKRNLLPLEHLNRLSSQISCGNDLSKRINLPSKKDEVHQLAQTFDHMMERLEQSFQREKAFTCDVSHELRTPISVIRAECEYGLREDTSPLEKTDSLEVILRQASIMSSLTSQLLSLSRMEQGQETLHPQTLCVSQLLSFVADSLEQPSLEKKIVIHKELPSSASYSGDEHMLIRLFTNLIQNAITYGKEKGNIWISLFSYKDYLEVIIKDDGRGISQEDLPRIWDRFYQADSSRNKSHHGGSGLGLSFCKQIVQLHGGTIEVKSILHEGSQFKITLPKKN